MSALLLITANYFTRKVLLATLSIMKSLFQYNITLYRLIIS